jgi:D-ribose pyranase
MPASWLPICREGTRKRLRNRFPLGYCCLLNHYFFSKGGTVKRGTLLNAPVSSVIATLGHGDAICIGDAGLPVPKGVERIDLAVTRGMPPFLGTVEAVLSELCVERAVVATEFSSGTAGLHAELLRHLSAHGSLQSADILVENCPHEQFKALTANCRAIIRTGECTPYANVIFYAGVPF